MVHYSVFFSYSVMAIQVEDGPSDCLVLSGIASLGLNGADLSELVDFEVSRDLLEVVSIES